MTLSVYSFEITCGKCCFIKTSYNLHELRLVQSVAVTVKIMNHCPINKHAKCHCNHVKLSLHLPWEINVFI